MAYMIIMGVFTLIFLCLGIIIGDAWHDEVKQIKLNPKEYIKEVFTKEPDLDPIQVDEEREYEIEQERNGR